MLNLTFDIESSVFKLSITHAAPSAILSFTIISNQTMQSVLNKNIFNVDTRSAPI